MGVATNYEGWLIMRVDGPTFFYAASEITSGRVERWARFNPADGKIVLPDDWDLASYDELEDAVLAALVFASGERELEFPDA